MQTDGARTPTAMTVPKATLIGPIHNTITSPPTCSCGLSKGTYKALSILIPHENGAYRKPLQTLEKGGGYLTKFNTGTLRPEVSPLTLLHTILAEKVPLLYTFY